MKRKSLILFLIVTITVLSMSAINRTYAKYKFTVQNDINISTEEFYTSIIRNNNKEVYYRDTDNKIIVNQLTFKNYEDSNYTKVPITYEVSVLDGNNSTEKFGIKYNNQTSTDGKLNITIDETSSIKDTIPNIEITENLDSSNYSEQETFTLIIKAVAPYEKDLITEVFTYSMKHRLGIQLDYNKYSIVNLSTQSYFTADEIDLFSGVSVKYNPEGKAIKDIVNLSHSINYETNGTYTVTYTPIGEEYLEEEVTRTVEVGMTPETLNYTFNSSVPYYTLQKEYKGLNKFDLYGSKASNGYAANGGYATGTLNSLSYDGDLYLYLGGMASETIQAGYNGGGNGYHYKGSYSRFGGGGGATDIRLVSGAWNNQTSLASRIMVAGGGGSGCLWGSSVRGGVGGGLTGGTGGAVKGAKDTRPGSVAGGSQIAAGPNGAFGKGSNHLSCGAAGGGYYGGGTSAAVDGYRQSGSGGSGYISGHAGCIAIKSATNITPKVQTYSQLSDSYHYSGLIFKNTSMSSGTNNGAGKATVTAYLKKSNS